MKNLNKFIELKHKEIAKDKKRKNSEGLNSVLADSYYLID